jgi:alpha-glucosidase (family GH31 glycosyl hydrolase)
MEPQLGSGCHGKRFSRRQVLKQAAASTALALTNQAPLRAEEESPATDSNLEIQIARISDCTFRLTISPLENGQSIPVPDDGSLTQSSRGSLIAKIQGPLRNEIVTSDLIFKISPEPLTIAIETPQSEKVQQLTIDRKTGALSFQTGNTPLLGLGEGGPQFDRRGSVDAMRSGQDGYQLHTHGGRVPIPWLISTAGWAMFIHNPFGTFDFSGPESKFVPSQSEFPFPLDLFFISSRNPATLMAEYARLTGYPEMPPLWSLGYQQSHRTLASREEILSEAKTFREKRLPCDAMIYLGTGFCPSGWNTENGSFAWNNRVFPNPREMIKQFHEDNFRVVLHVVILSDRLRGTVHDTCDVTRFDEEQASCYWDAHRADFALGVDGWWPDEGDPLDKASRLVRNRMYWEGPQLDRPKERPYALHRNGYAGMQRYGSFLWSGDVYSTWKTLQVHISNAINTGLSGIPYWGTDIGGFVPTSEFTAELYLRWFQFAAFCPLFRAHGRTWKLRLPWGWNTGDPGPIEISSYNGAAVPDSSKLHDPSVEPICRKYLELRYRLLPYLYSAVRECATTGMPIIRALWLHYPQDAIAVGRGDEYLWGRNILVAPVVEAGATSRQLYLPQGNWFDFWTGERVAGGREITRKVDLETLPVYVCGGSILPMGPVKQYTAEKIDVPLSIVIYPGADSKFLLYEDDGISFQYRTGNWMGIEMAWNDSRRLLTLDLARGSRMLEPIQRHLDVTLENTTRRITFDGHPVAVQF